MLLTDEFKFGKYKGVTLQDVLKSEQGQDYLHWFVKQPCKNPEFAEYDNTQKDAIRRKLAQQSGHHNPNDVSSTMYLAGEIESLKERVGRVELRIAGGAINEPKEETKPADMDPPGIPDAVKDMADSVGGTVNTEPSGWDE